MNISTISLRDLEYMVAVAEHKHFGKAAIATHVSQPALSAQIKKVEDFLQVRLFERSNRSVVITPIGSRIIAQARIVLEEAQKIAELALNDLEPLAGPLRLGAIATLGPYYLPHVISPIRKKFNRLELYLREGKTEGLIAELKAGSLDAVLASPPFLEDDSLRQIPLFIEPLLLAAPKGHPLTLKDSLRSNDLRASEMILLEDGHCLKDQTLETCSVNRRGNYRQYHATSLETLRHLVASGLGYTLIPFLAAKDDPKLRSLITYRSFDGKPGLGRQIALVCRSKFPRLNDLLTLTEYLRQIRPEGTLPT